MHCCFAPKRNVLNPLGEAKQNPCIQLSSGHRWLLGRPSGLCVNMSSACFPILPAVSSHGLSEQIHGSKGAGLNGSGQ